MRPETGVFAMDVDAAPPHAHDSIAARQALEANYGVTPTRIHRTASGGSHLLFCWPPERGGSRLRREGPSEGIECKGEGGSIIFPPSEHSGGKYSVASGVVIPLILLEVGKSLNAATAANQDAFPSRR